MDFEVKDMTCGHCAAAITKAVKGVDAQAAVNIDIAAKVVHVESTRSVDGFLSAIRDAGYNPTALV